MQIGKIAGRAANLAADTVGELVGSSPYPETEYGLAAYLFERIAQAEKQDAPRDRAYYLELMRTCLAAVREGKG